MLDFQSCCGRIRQTAIAICLMALPAWSLETMPAAQQNALVEKYCAVCHTGIARNGGLSLEHFDSASAPPSLIAMLLSKLTGGLPLASIRAAHDTPRAAALLDNKMKSGAMGAAGIPIPDNATINALIHAFAKKSAGAMDWTVERPTHSSQGQKLIVISTLKEIPSATVEDESRLYRLIASCNLATGDGDLQLTWSPQAVTGSLYASTDGAPALRYQVEGSEKMGNGSGLVLKGLAAISLAETKAGAPRTGLRFPAESLIIMGLFPDEKVRFSFTSLSRQTHRELSACFPNH